MFHYHSFTQKSSVVPWIRYSINFTEKSFRNHIFVETFKTRLQLWYYSLNLIFCFDFLHQLFFSILFFWVNWVWIAVPCQPFLPAGSRGAEFPPDFDDDCFPQDHPERDYSPSPPRISDFRSEVENIPERQIDPPVAAKKRFQALQEAEDRR